MIQRMSHCTVYVTDQEAAKQFYVEKLGFEVRTDSQFGEGFRWLTVGPKGQRDLEVILMEPTTFGCGDKKGDTVAKIKELIAKGAFGMGVFATSDCQATYAELKAKGVEFLSPPRKMPYGMEAVMKDNSGNWFSLCQRDE